MFPGDGRQAFIETDLACGMATDVNRKLGKILDLPFQGALNMNKLNGDVWNLGHVVPPACFCSGVAVRQLRDGRLAPDGL
jgi:hypothetical protein